MVAYRLDNDIASYQEMFVDFKAMRRQYSELRVSFNEDNISLYDNLLNEWQPVDLFFEQSSLAQSAAKLPDLSLWNISCVVLSKKAHDALGGFLDPFGEFLPLKDGYHLFNCLTSIDRTCVDERSSSFDLDAIENSMFYQKSLSFIDKKLEGIEIFKPSFTHNGMLLCQAPFKELVEANALGGLVFRA